MADALGVALVGTLAGVLGFSGLAKLVRPEKGELFFPRMAATTLAVVTRLIGAAEMGVACLLLLEPQIGAVAAACLFVTFAVAQSTISGYEDCGCYPGSGSRSEAWRIGRCIALAMLASAAAAGSTFELTVPGVLASLCLLLLLALLEDAAPNGPGRPQRSAFVDVTGS